MSRIDRLVVVFGLAALAAAGAMVSAQEQAPPAPEQTQAAPGPADDTDAAEPASAGASQDASDDEFIPTEEIPADEEVTFPVDI